MHGMHADDANRAADADDGGGGNAMLMMEDDEHSRSACQRVCTGWKS